MPHRRIGPTGPRAVRPSGGAGLGRLRLLTLGALVLGGCARVTTGLPPAAPVAAGWSETGIASWYGEPFHGRLTASGEVYDMEAPTAAHRTLPFGTVVQVDNLDSGRSTVLRINDRGPFVRGRTIDVSRRAARELAMIGPGTARVRVTILETAAAPTCWEVQAGAFERAGNAEELRNRLLRDGHAARVETGPDGLHRVRAGPLASQDDASVLAASTGGLLLGCALADA